MKLLNQGQYHAAGVLFMLAGCVAILFSLTVLNNLGNEGEKKQEKREISFQVKAPVKPKKTPQTKPRQRKQPRSAPRPLPSVDLDTDLAGLDLGLEDFGQDTNQVDESLLGDMNNVVMTSNMVDVAPKPKILAPLEYPARARARELEGYVVLSLLIDVEGRVEMVKVLEADPEGVFDQAAINTVRRWIFEPARYKGQPVSSWANQTIRFELG